MEELQIVKKKRADVAKRKETNKEIEYSCVKVSWKSLVKNNYLKNGIQEIVLNINKISFLSYKLINFHFTRLIQYNLPLPDLTQNLFYKACTCVSIMKDRKTTIDETDELVISFNLFKHCIPQLPFFIMLLKWAF